MTREKKFLSPKICSYGDDLAKRWRVEYWEPTHNGNSAKRVVKYISNEATVEDRYRAAYMLINSFTFTPEPEKKTILHKVLDMGALDWRPKTLSTYKTVVNAYLPFLKKRVPEMATEETINEFLLSVFKNTGKQSTVNKYRDVLYLLYNKAEAQKLTGMNPVRKIPRKKKQATSLLYFNDSHIETIKTAQKEPQLWLAIQLLFYCFIRPGEIRCLKIADINFDYSFIEINSSFSKNRKTEKVIIPAIFINKLMHLKNYSNNHFVISKNGEPGLVQVSTNWIYNTHHKLLDNLNIRGRYSFYSWKHTGVVKAVKAGVNIKDLQLQLRHHSLDMVNEYLKNLGVLDSEDLRNKFPTL